MLNVNGLRIGIGFDVHPFQEGRPLKLGSIEIPFEKGLVGHSDADVLIHAIVDSILGALTLGDLGQHFPSEDPQWKNASSLLFLDYAKKELEKKSARILSIDSTLILEKPKIAPYVLKIRKALALHLGIGLNQISVKATTTEKMGFLGREEGIAAQAICLLLLNE